VNKGIMDLLACPICNGALVIEEEVLVDDKVTSGSLVCIECKERYPIEDGIPNLLPPNLR